MSKNNLQIRNWPVPIGNSDAPHQLVPPNSENRNPESVLSRPACGTRSTIARGTIIVNIKSRLCLLPGATAWSFDGNAEAMSCVDSKSFLPVFRASVLNNLLQSAQSADKVPASLRSFALSASLRLDRKSTNHFPVAARPVRSHDRENDEWPSPQTRHGVAGHCGSLAPLPGTDYHPSKPETKCVNHFTQMLVSQLTRSHRWVY